MRSGPASVRSGLASAGPEPASVAAAGSGITIKLQYYNKNKLLVTTSDSDLFIHHKYSRNFCSQTVWKELEYHQNVIPQKITIKKILKSLNF